MLKIGDKSPNFSLEGVVFEKVENYSLDTLLENKKYVILYFYPKDNTSGCAKESLMFNSLLPKIKDTYSVVGVSGDSIKSHISFQATRELKFPLLFDENLSLASAYGATKPEGSILRSTFIINNVHEIVAVWYDVKVSMHEDEVLSALESL